jgi:hypothetical protein
MPDNYSPYGHPKGHTDANGNWVRNEDVPINDGSDNTDAGTVELELNFDAATADGATLFTLPKDMLIEDALWDITEAFTGGSSSAIGISSDTAPATAKGAILGGASGDVAATLTVGKKQGTAGSAMSTDLLLPAGAKIRFDRITSAFTDGAGTVHLIGRYVS